MPTMLPNFIYICIFFTIISFGHLSAKNFSFDFKIKGQVKGYADSTKLFLDDVSSNKRIKTLDSIFVINERFEFSGVMSEDLKKVMIRTEDYKEFRTFWLEKSIAYIYSEGGQLTSAKVTGSRAQQTQDKLDSLLTFLDLKEVELKQKFSNKVSDQKKLTYANQLKEIKQRRMGEISLSIRNNKNWLLGTALLSSYGSILPRDTVFRLYRNLKEDFKRSSFGKDVTYHFIFAKNAPQIGDKYLDFEQPDQDGNIITFSEIRANLTLLEFWASGCGPCRIENPNLVRIYKAFKNKGFEIVSVSLDRRKESWIKAIKDDGLLWLHVSDLKFMSNEAVKKYGVMAIPNNFLINEEGVIIGINLRNVELEQKIEEYFNQ